MRNALDFCLKANVAILTECKTQFIAVIEKLKDRL